MYFFLLLSEKRKMFLHISTKVNTFAESHFKVKLN